MIAEGCDQGFRTVINDGPQGCKHPISAPSLRDISPILMQSVMPQSSIVHSANPNL